MGHESPIEPWLAADNRAAWESPNRLASSRQSDENRWQKKPTALREASSVRDHRTEGQNNPAQTGWAGSQEKIRPQERCFFLDSFYRTNQELASGLPDFTKLQDPATGIAPFIWDELTTNPCSQSIEKRSYLSRLDSIPRPRSYR